GGIVSVLSGMIMGVTSTTQIVDVRPAYAGFVSVFFALCYALFYARGKKRINLEQIWEENRESVVKFFLTVVDDDVNSMTPILEKLELEGFDFNSESSIISLRVLGDNDYYMFKERFDKLPLLQNVLGFITDEQYHAVYDYLKYSKMFVDFLYNEQTYKRDPLKFRAEQAQKILDLFSGEEKNHSGLKTWKSRIQYF
ncbi:MAG: hypothetical protein KGL95_15480, partial [Patescibacteria group bacterium]|nr:hypothetical protein [Patescibacteria group bacterium]